MNKKRYYPVIWKITEVRHCSLCEKSDTDPEAEYIYFMRDTEEKNHTASDYISYSNLLLLMKYFGVNTISELVGKSFKDEYEGLFALQLVITPAKVDYDLKGLHCPSCGEPTDIDGAVCHNSLCDNYCGE
jgi:hypothetical protein